MLYQPGRQVPTAAFSNSLSIAGSYKNPKHKINFDHIIMLGRVLLVHFSASSGSRRLRRHRKRILLGISLKNDRFRRSQNLLPQKLYGFADFAEIRNTCFETIRVYSFGTFFCFFWFSETSQTSKMYSCGHLSRKRQISKPSASKTGRFRRVHRDFRFCK